MAAILQHFIIQGWKRASVCVYIYIYIYVYVCEKGTAYSLNKNSSFKKSLPLQFTLFELLA